MALEDSSSSQQTSGSTQLLSTTKPLANSNRQNNNNGGNVTSNHQQQQASSSSYLFIGSSAAFQQVKQTQASLARLSRVHQQLQLGQTNQSSQNQHHQQLNKEQPSGSSQLNQTQLTTGTGTRSTTFVDCLIRRFKDCFNEDCFSVPMFVVGNLSPGSDGTHLILPPCVSLGRQNISRFAGPKNLRLMNSIRESCRSIEELDLGGNKLTDLIEVYKILQCSPNLRFLNLSENDLSRASPVAMAATCSNLTATTNTTGSPFLTTSYQQTVTSGPATGSQNWASHRACLAPISQNSPSQAATGAGTMGARRHSTLGQPMGPLPAPTGTTTRSQLRQAAGTRLSESRRLAAAAALAQSKKTSPSVASKLANSAAAASTRPSSSGSRLAASGTRLTAGSSSASCSGRDGLVVGKAASTMHLARSLSSLSAKDVRVAASASRSSTNVQQHRSSMRHQATGSKSSLSLGPSRAGSARAAEVDAANKQQMVVSSSKSNGALAKHLTESSIVEQPIDESDDVEMNAGNASATTSETTVTASVTAINQQQQTRALNQHTGTSHTLTSRQQTGPTMSQSSTSGQSSATNFRRTFRSIKALALNNTGCPWRVVCSILSRMPNLEELHLSLNNYERIDLEPSEFKHPALKRLYLCNNPKLTDWQELDKLLAAFPSLEALSIADCNISQIPDNLDRASEWRKLCGLNINGWPIKEWPVIERLNQLPSLIDLKCRNLELLNTIDEPRHHLIARLPKLQRLNGSEIEEREDAEKAFLRFFMANSHLERPTRYHELVRIHGEVAPLSIDVDVDLSPPIQARVRVIYLNRSFYRKENEDDILMSEDFLCKLMDSVEEAPVAIQGSDSMEVNEVDIDGDNKQPVRLFKDEGQEVVAIDIDLRQSVRKFKSTLAQLFGLSGHQNLILYYIDHEMVGLMGPELIKHNQKKLWNYNVQDGDQFIVEKR